MHNIQIKDVITTVLSLERLNNVFKEQFHRAAYIRGHEMY